MWSAIAAWLAGIWGKIAIAGAIVATVALVVLRIRRDGMLAERARQREKIDEALRDQKRRDEGFRALPPDERRERLRKQRDELRRLLSPK